AVRPGSKLHVKLIAALAAALALASGYSPCFCASHRDAGKPATASHRSCCDPSPDQRPERPHGCCCLAGTCRDAALAARWSLTAPAPAPADDGGTHANAVAPALGAPPSLVRRAARILPRARSAPPPLPLHLLYSTLLI